MKDIAILVPTRGRFKRLKECYDSFLQLTEGLADFIIVTDHDEQELYDWCENTEIINLPSPTIEDFVQKVNFAYDKLPKYKHYFVLSDDFIFQTPYESILLKQAGKQKYSMFYGDDTMQHERIPTMQFISGNIPEKLGYILFPQFKHLFCDVAFKVLGEKLGCLKYFPEIIIEHRHYLKDASLTDDSYLRSNSFERYKEDGFVFADWYVNFLEKELELLENE